MSVCLPVSSSVCMYQRGSPTGRIAVKFDISDFYENLFLKIQICLRFDEIIRHVTWRPKYVFLLFAGDIKSPWKCCLRGKCKSEYNAHLVWSCRRYSFTPVSLCFAISSIFVGLLLGIYIFVVYLTTSLTQNIMTCRMYSGIGKDMEWSSRGLTWGAVPNLHIPGGWG